MAKDNNKIRFCKIEPVSLLEVLNSMHPAIQFKIAVSESNLPFHDIMIHNDGNETCMDMYSRPTYSKGYSPFDFNYPRTCLKNMPFA